MRLSLVLGVETYFGVPRSIDLYQGAVGAVLGLSGLLLSRARWK